MKNLEMNSFLPSSFWQFPKSQWGVLWWLRVKEPTCKCRRYMFNPWVGKIPWARK
jgi:hypothetical protein